MCFLQCTNTNGEGKLIMDNLFGGKGLVLVDVVVVGLNSPS